MNEELEVMNEIEEVTENTLTNVDSEQGNNALAIAGVVGGVVTVGYLGYRFIAKPIAKKVKGLIQKRKDKKSGVVEVEFEEVNEDSIE